MRDSDPEAMLEADLKVSESFLNQITLQLESYEMSQHMQEQHATAWPCDHLAGKHAQALKILVDLSINVDLYEVSYICSLHHDIVILSLLLNLTNGI